LYLFYVLKRVFNNTFWDTVVKFILFVVIMSLIFMFVMILVTIIAIVYMKIIR
jgi:hypothetical protein